MTESVTGSAGGVNYNIAQAPLYFVRSGYTSLNSGKLRNAVLNGGWWSSTPHSNGVNGYNLYFNATGVDPSNNFNRWFGFSLRCLSTVLDI